MRDNPHFTIFNVSEILKHFPYRFRVLSVNRFFLSEDGIAPPPFFSSIVRRGIQELAHAHRSANCTGYVNCDKWMQQCLDEIVVDFFFTMKTIQTLNHLFTF